VKGDHGQLPLGKPVLGNGVGLLDARRLSAWEDRDVGLDGMGQVDDGHGVYPGGKRSFRWFQG